MTPKEKLYYLLKEFLYGKYDANTFSDQFTTIYDTEVDYDTLSEIEMKLFGELCEITARFSSYEEDLKIPNAYFNEQQVKTKAEEVYKQLMQST